jgi:hypothetical protein
MSVDSYWHGITPGSGTALAAEPFMMFGNACHSHDNFKLLHACVFIQSLFLQ